MTKPKKCEIASLQTWTKRRDDVPPFVAAKMSCPPRALVFSKKLRLQFRPTDRPTDRELKTVAQIIPSEMKRDKMPEVEIMVQTGPASSYICRPNLVKCCRGLSSRDWKGRSVVISNATTESDQFYECFIQFIDKKSV